MCGLHFVIDPKDNPKDQRDYFKEFQAWMKDLQQKQIEIPKISSFAKIDLEGMFEDESCAVPFILIGYDGQKNLKDARKVY